MINAEYITHSGDDLLVINAARVSFDKQKEKFDEGDARLIAYLAKHNHFTPFTHPQITLRISAPIFVARQLQKHQVGLTWNEVSRRYVDDEPEFFFPVLRKRPNNGMKQGSRDEFPDQLEQCESLVSTAYSIALAAYKELLKQEVAPEQARMVLPQSMMTSWFWTGSLAAFARVCNLRLDPHSQKETQEIAGMISDILSPLFPVSWPVLVREQQKEIPLENHCTP